MTIHYQSTHPGWEAGKFKTPSVPIPTDVYSLVTSEDISRTEEILGYKFNDVTLLIKGLTASGAAVGTKEEPGPHTRSRLYTFGSALWQFIITEKICTNTPPQEKNHLKQKLSDINSDFNNELLLDRCGLSGVFSTTDQHAKSLTFMHLIGAVIADAGVNTALKVFSSLASDEYLKPGKLQLQSDDKQQADRGIVKPDRALAPQVRLALENLLGYKFSTTALLDGAIFNIDRSGPMKIFDDRYSALGHAILQLFSAIELSENPKHFKLWSIKKMQLKYVQVSSSSTPVHGNEFITIFTAMRGNESRPNPLSWTLKSMIGAIYRDAISPEAGLNAAHKVVLNIFPDLCAEPPQPPVNRLRPKPYRKLPELPRSAGVMKPFPTPPLPKFEDEKQAAGPKVEPVSKPKEPQRQSDYKAVLKLKFLDVPVPAPKIKVEQSMQNGMPGYLARLDYHKTLHGLSDLTAHCPTQAEAEQAIAKLAIEKIESREAYYLNGKSKEKNFLS